MKTTIFSVIVLLAGVAQAQVADLNGGNIQPPPIGQDPSDAPPPPPPPGGPSDVNNQPTPPQPIPPQNPNRPQWPNDQDDDQGMWPSQPQAPQVSAQVLQRACNASMQGRAKLRFGEELFRSGDFVLNVRVQGLVSPNVYSVMAVTSPLSRKDPVINNDTGAGTCTIDMYGRVVMNLRFNKRGEMNITSDNSIVGGATAGLSYQGRVESSIGDRRVQLNAR